jgi:hypothetical protein
MGKKFYLDLLERSVWTFIQAAGGIAIASGGFGVEVWKAALYAGGFAVLKALAASQIGKHTAALPDPPE